MSAPIVQRHIYIFFSNQVYHYISATDGLFWRHHDVPGGFSCPHHDVATWTGGCETEVHSHVFAKDVIYHIRWAALSHQENPRNTYLP